MSVNVKVNLDDKEAKQKLQQLQDGKYNIKMDVNAQNIKNTSQSMNTLTLSTKKTMSAFDRLKAGIKDTFSTGKLAMTGYLMVMNELRKAGKQSIEVIEDVDQAITDLSIASGMTREATAGLVKDYNNYAKELKATTTQITSAADDYLRAGKTMSQAKELIKDSIMLSKLGQISSSESTEDLLATMNGYNMSVEEVSKALDAMVAIDFKAATSSGDLATGLKYSASSAASAEVSFNKLVAILGTVQDRTQQSAEVVGTFANTMLSRYRDVTIGKYLSDDGDDISNYEAVLKSVGIQLRDEQGEFRDFETVLQEMADKWNGLTSAQQNALIKVAAGTRQQNRFIALMENYNKVLELTEVAANSAGTALDKFNNSYANSLEAKKNTLQASFESMIVNSDMSEVYSGIIEATTDLVNFINSTNALKGAMTALSVSGFIKGFAAVRTGINEAYISLNQFQNAYEISKRSYISDYSFERLLTLSNGLSDSQMKLILSSKSLTNAQREQILVNAGLSTEEAKLKLETWGMTTANNGLTVATTSLKNAALGLWNTLLANPLLIVTAAVSATVMAYNSYKQKLEETRQANISASDSASELANNLTEAYEKYVKLSNITKRTTEEEDEYKQVIEDITGLLGDRAQALQWLSAGTEEYTAKLKELTKAELLEQQTLAVEGRKNAEEEFSNVIFSQMKGSKVSIDSNSKGKSLSDKAQKAVDIVSDSLKEFETVNRTWDNLSWGISSDDPEEAVKYYNALVEARQKLIEASKADSDEALLDTEIHNDLNNAINAMSDKMDTYISKKYEELKLDYMIQNGIPTTTEEYQKMGEAIKALAGDNEAVQNSVMNLFAQEFPDGINITTNEGLQQSYEDTINRFKSSEESSLEELKQSYQEAIDKRKELYSGENYVGNVDINNRPVVINDDGSYSTTSTSFQEKWIGDEENGHYIIAHFTPILPDGTVLDEVSLNEYIDKILNSDDPMEADKVENGGKGIVYKVDTEINGKEIKDDNLEDAFGVADAWDVDMHNLQDKMYKDEAKIKGQITQFGNDVDGSQKIKDFFDTEGINTQDEIDAFNDVTKGITDADLAIQKWNEHKKEAIEAPISKSITENINDLEDLNKELDKLGTAMANIDDAGNFDLGDLDAVADYFLGLKDIPYDVTEVSNALKTLGDGTSTLEQQKDAIDSLADEYLKTSGILDDLNESNAELIQLQLQRMGIENAEEIVNTSLQNEQAVLQQKAQLQQTLIDQGYQLINVTWAEIEAMQNEGIITQQNAQYLAALALQKQIQNGALDESANIANLQALAAQMGSTGSTISYWLGIIAHAGSASVADKARENATNAINEALNKFSNTSFKVKVPKAKYNGGSPIANKLNKNNGGGSNSKSKEQKSINEIDLFKRRVDVLNDALELLQKNLDNVTGYDAKNTLLNQSIAITQEEIKNYSDAVQMYSAKASEALSKVPEAYRDAAQNGKVELLTEEVLGSAADENDKTVKELIDSYTGWADSVADAKQKLAELKTELRQLELDKFKNIVEDYSNRTDIFENSQDLINKQIDLFKEAGQVIGEGFYQSLIDEENSKLSLLTEEQQKLIQEMESGISNGTIEKGTDEWNEMLESLNDVNGAILDSKKSIEEFNNSIQQLHWDTIERIKNDFSELSDEIDFLYNLLEDDDHISDDFGNWSDNALAQLGLMAQSYEQHVYASQKLQGEIDELSNAYKRGEYSETEYLEKLYDLKDQQRSEVDASEKAKDSIMSLAKARTDIMVNAINKEIDSMSELIDKKKEALSAEKSLHEYRKSIEESSNNIAKIEQQLAAMQGDDTASTIAKRKKLEEELANAKKELEEQEYSHSIETQQDALDQQLEDFKESKNAEIEALQQYLENQEQVIFDAFEIIKQNTETVASSISLIAQDHGYQVSNTLTSSWAAGENAITSYNQAITDASSIFAQNLTAMQNAEWSLQQQANATAISVASVYTASAQNLLNELTTSYVAESNLKTMTDALRDSLITCLDRGYNIGSLITQLHGVADAASSAASSVNNLMNAFSGTGSSGTYQYGTGNTVYYYDSNGQKHITSKSQAENAGYTAPTSDRQDLLKKKAKKTSKKAKGGLITKKSAGSFDSIAKSIGEDHMIAVKDNETVLTPVQTQGWLKLIDNLDAYNKSLQPDIIKPNIPKNSNIPNSTVTLNYDHLIEVQGDVNNSNIKDIENAVINSVNEQIKQFTTALKRVGVR